MASDKKDNNIGKELESLQGLGDRLGEADARRSATLRRLQEMLKERERDVQAKQEELAREREVRWLAEKELERERATLYTILDQAPVGLTLITPEGVIQYRNSRISDMLGYRPGELGNVETALEELFDSGQARETGRRAWEMFLTQSGQDAQFRVRRKDGTFCDLEMRNIILEDGRVVVALSDITRRLADQEELRRSREQLATVADGIPGVVAFIDASLVYLYVNKAYAEWFGRPQEDIVGRRVQEVVSQEGYRLVEPDLKAALAGESRTFEFQADHPRLGQRILLGTFAPHRGEGGDVEAVFSLFVDQTEQRQVQAALADSTEKLGMAMSAANMGTWDYDFETQSVVWGPNHARLFGISGSEFNGTLANVRECIHPEDRSDISREMEQVVRDGGHFDREFRIVHPDGDVRWMYSHGSLIHDEEGRPERLLGVTMDITARKDAEKALRESERKYRTIFEYSGDAIFLHDLTPRFLDVNQVACRRLGYTREELLGMSPADIDSPEFIPKIEANLGMLRDTGQLTLETAHIARDGTVIPTEINARLIEYKGAPAVLSLARDITDRKRAEERIMQAKEEAEVASRSKTEFLANMSHEIRTPLNSVMGMLQLLQFTSLDTEQEECVTTAMTSCSSLLTVINDILDLSKVEAGKMEIIRKPFGTRQLVDSIRDAFKDQAAKKGLELSMDVHPSVPEYVIGDTSRIRQILFNLVGNSMKFTPRGTIHVRMSGLSREDPRRVGVVFEVSDTGIGVSQEQMQDLFEPFTQVESDYSRSYQGTGLGLGIVKRLVLLMGGSLCMDSEPGRGTSTFFRLDFELPYPLYPEREAGVTTEAAAIEEGFEAQAPQESDVAASGEKSLSVLVAEDNRINRITATRFLAKLGHEAVCAESGEEALELLASRHFDCVLMDVQMPVMDGIEATSRIRAGEAPGVDPDLPVIAMTAHAMIGDREQIMKAGMDDYVAKPIEMDLLEAALARVAARRGRTGES